MNIINVTLHASCYSFYSHTICHVFYNWNGCLGVSLVKQQKNNCKKYFANTLLIACFFFSDSKVNIKQGSLKCRLLID